VDIVSKWRFASCDCSPGRYNKIMAAGYRSLMPKVPYALLNRGYPYGTGVIHVGQGIVTGVQILNGTDDAGISSYSASGRVCCR
jgi:hypothetical protein